MKKVTLLCMLVCSIAYAQSPVVEGTYLPVRGTTVKEVWDVQAPHLPLPQGGTNMTWDYSSNFIVMPGDTFELKTFVADSTPYFKYFDSINNPIVPDFKYRATHASFLRAPAVLPSLDSLFNYYVIDTNGLYNLGAFDMKKSRDTAFIAYHPELLTPFRIEHPDSAVNNIKIVGYFWATLPVLGLKKIKYVGTIDKTLKTLGYGTLKTPVNTFPNTILAKEHFNQIDTFYVDNNGAWVYPGSLYPAVSSQLDRYSFFRNNTFGSSVLLLLVDGNANATIDYGWYTLPVNFGSISGRVYTDSTAANLVTSGSNEVYLYRENSNFAKNDILVKTTVDANGYYQFDSIPYGLYRISCRPDTGVYQTLSHVAMTTYFGGATEGNSADLVNTLVCECDQDSVNIMLKYYPRQTNPVMITGHVFEDMSFYGSMHRQAHHKGSDQFFGKSISGIDISIKKKPSSASNNNSMSARTNGSGEWQIDRLDSGCYTVYVDMPGLEMHNSHDFCVSTNGDSITGLNFIAGLDSIYKDSVPITTGVVKNNKTKAGLVEVYPNPFNNNLSVAVYVKENAISSLQVYDVLGNKVYEQNAITLSAGKNMVRVNTQSLATGIYTLRLTVNDKVYTHKVSCVK